MKMRLVLIGLVVASVLSGCGQAVTDAKLTYERQKLREECIGENTNDCRSKTIDFNLSVVNSHDYKSDDDALATVTEMFGKDSFP